MSDLLAGELLKLRTTRAPALLLAGFVALVLLALTGPSMLVGSRHTSHPLIEGVGTLATVFALLLGIIISAGDQLHGTLRATLLIEPRRQRLFAARLAIAAGAGLSIGALAALLATTVAPLTTTPLSGKEALLTSLGLTAASVLFALLGHAAGTIAGNQTIAVAVSLVWLLVIEQLIAQTSYIAYSYLPGGSREALLRHHSHAHHIPPMWLGALTLVAYALTLTLTARRALQRRELS
jgi:hypothetical protein